MTQATVVRYRDGSGRAVTDRGAPIDFDAAAVRAGGLRLLRAGQRVELVSDPDGQQVVRLIVPVDETTCHGS